MTKQDRRIVSALKMADRIWEDNLSRRKLALELDDRVSRLYPERGEGSDHEQPSPKLCAKNAA
jgi:hypothetical protein